MSNLDDLPGGGSATATLPSESPGVAPLTLVEDKVCLNRGAMAATGFLAGWIPVTCCSMGIVPAVLSGLGLGTSYFAIGNTLLWGLGWMPILVLASLLMVAAVSYVQLRHVFSTQPRSVAWRAYRRTTALTTIIAGVTFVVWMEIVMPVLYALGVPMGSLFAH